MTVKPKQTNLALVRQEKIAKRVEELAAAGVSVKEILASVAHYQYAPASLATLYKYYQVDMDRGRGKVTEIIGSKVIQQAQEGDFNSQKLWLTTKGGWAVETKNTEVVVDVTEDNSTALQFLLDKLDITEEKEE
jgi:hypothetical protein